MQEKIFISGPADGAGPDRPQPASCHYATEFKFYLNLVTFRNLEGSNPVFKSNFKLIISQSMQWQLQSHMMPELSAAAADSAAGLRPETLD